jgi:hypothetical protein
MERSGVQRRDCSRAVALEALFASDLDSNRRITTHFGNPTIESEKFLGCYQDFFLIKQPDWQVRPPQYRRQRKPELFEPSRQDTLDPEARYHGQTIAAVFRESMSMTKRYFTSLFSNRL